MVTAAAVTTLPLLALHLLCPWAAWKLHPRNPTRAYDWLTIGVAAAVLLLAPPEWDRIAAQAWWPAVASATLAGLALPFLVAVALRRRLVRRPTPAMSHLARTIVCAAGEELLWRYTAPLALMVGLGLPAWTAWVAATAGFLALHVPGFGWRRLPYIALTATLFTTAYLAAGLGGAVAAHAAHNLLLDTYTTDPRKRSPTPPVPPGTLPAPSDW
ncbi:CPBP family glutamic-type intramembrane protease [Longimycelium tulufanense]|uniref:CPBP family glutamic-type intramembrane protease n=1 Tax=Longimycelium tulufanense TaxID=907463 RepID=UPI00166320F8|nr:CPBP family glutamic-type intramembrane protease [Longimycelium tulufanense]